MRTLPLLFPNLFTSSLLTSHESHPLMRTRLTHNDDDSGYTLSIKHSALHGRSVEEITLNVERDVLSLHIASLKLDLPEDVHPVWQEIPQSEYNQLIRLPQGVDESLIHAQLIDNELILNLPKHAPVKHQISISSAA